MVSTNATRTSTKEKLDRNLSDRFQNSTYRNSSRNESSSKVRVDKNEKDKLYEIVFKDDDFKVYRESKTNITKVNKKNTTLTKLSQNLVNVA